MLWQKKNKNNIPPPPSRVPSPHTWRYCTNLIQALLRNCKFSIFFIITCIKNSCFDHVTFGSYLDDFHGYGRNVIVLYEFLFACLVELPKDNSKFKRQKMVMILYTMLIYSYKQHGLALDGSKWLISLPNNYSFGSCSSFQKGIFVIFKCNWDYYGLLAMALLNKKK